MVPSRHAAAITVGFSFIGTSPPPPATLSGMENHRLQIAFWFSLLAVLRGLTSSEWVLVAFGSVGLVWCAASVYLRRREKLS
jgi:hypothetical protein